MILKGGVEHTAVLCVCWATENSHSCQNRNNALSSFLFLRWWLRKLRNNQKQCQQQTRYTSRHSYNKKFFHLLMAAHQHFKLCYRNFVLRYDVARSVTDVPKDAYLLLETKLLTSKTFGEHEQQWKHKACVCHVNVKNSGWDFGSSFTVAAKN